MRAPLRSLVAVAVVGGAVAAPLAGGAAEWTPSTRIAEVTVYGDRARVVREATVQLGAGEHGIVVGGLPPGSLDESILAEGAGTAKALITGIEVSLAPLLAEREAEARKLQEELDAVRALEQQAADEVERYEREKAFLASLSQQAATRAGEQALATEAVARSIQAAAQAMHTELGRVLEGLRAATRRRAELQERAGVVEQELAKRQAEGAREEKRVRIGVTAQEAGRFVLRLAYVLPGASWSPVYDARVEPEKGRISLQVGAQVGQRTGESWDGVKLQLSTARPAEGIAPPELSPWYLQTVQPYRADKRRSSRAAEAAAPAGGGAFDGGLSSSAKMEAEEERWEEAEIATAEATEKGLSVVFAVGRPETVPSDGTRKRVGLAGEELQAELVHTAVPRLSPIAYLTGKVKHTADFPLLPGPVGTFLDGDFVGTSAVPLVASGEEFTLPFGPDEKVKVERKKVAQVSGKRVLLGTRERATYAFETTCQNLRGREVVLDLRDQVPVSQADRVKVSLGDGTTPPTEHGPDGVLRWELKLAPGAKQVVRLEYEVEYPKDERPWNLE